MMQENYDNPQMTYQNNSVDVTPPAETVMVDNMIPYQTQAKDHSIRSISKLSSIHIATQPDLNTDTTAISQYDVRADGSIINIKQNRIMDRVSRKEE